MTPNSTAARTSTSPPSISPDPPCDSGRSSDTGSLRSVTSVSSSNDVIIPDSWRADTQSQIDGERLDADSRNDICRTLTTLLAAKVGNHPSRQQIEQVSRSLIMKYPFMKDDMGSGYVRVH